MTLSLQVEGKAPRPATDVENPADSAIYNQTLLIGRVRKVRLGTGTDIDVPIASFDEFLRRPALKLIQERVPKGVKLNL